MLGCIHVKPLKLTLEQMNTGFVELFQKRCNCRRASSSSKRWQSRQVKDKYAINAKVQGLKSRAAYKLLEVDSFDLLETRHVAH